MSEHCEGCPQEADPAATCLCDRIEALRHEHLESVLPTLFALTARVAVLEAAEREVAVLTAKLKEAEGIIRAAGAEGMSTQWWGRAYAWLPAAEEAKPDA